MSVVRKVVDNRAGAGIRPIRDLDAPVITVDAVAGATDANDEELHGRFRLHEGATLDLERDSGLCRLREGLPHRNRIEDTALAVGQEDCEPMRRLRVEIALVRQAGQLLERRPREAVLEEGWRWLLDPDRVFDSGTECTIVLRREEMWKKLGRQRGDAGRHLRNSRIAKPDRSCLRLSESCRSIAARGRRHRARGV